MSQFHVLYTDSNNEKRFATVDAGDVVQAAWQTAAATGDQQGRLVAVVGLNDDGTVRTAPAP